ncbi:MAG: DUF2339 domain-containing protein [Calditrichia bacterium]|nr:DUF2339 domain-containing protein [Calditrichia bacterium]
MPKESDIQTSLAQIQASLKQLEKRIAHLETAVKKGRPEEEMELQPLIPENLGEVVDNLEFRIGQFWFAKAGIVILAIGIAFLLTLPFKNLPPYLPSIIGFSIVGLLLFSSYLLRESVSFLSRYLLGGGLILLYFSTLRLHFFTESAVISNYPVFIFLLILNVVLSLMVALRRNSPYLAGLAITLGFITAVVSKQPYVIFMLLTLLTSITVYLNIRKKWNRLLLYATVGVYFTHLIWFLNNPIMGNPVQLVTSPRINMVFILIYLVIFAMGIYLRKKDQPENNFVILNTFINCSFGYGLFLLISLTRMREILFVTHIGASVVFLALSILFWIRERSKYSTFFYSLLGYTALSVAILYYFRIPNSLVWLCWQSLLVISTALWFRSKIIVMANFIIFLLIFMGYLVVAKDIGLSSLSFGIVGLLSARIMNWQKSRLELQTELMRNLYLISAFFTIPYALYFNVPKGYISLSWLGVAIIYYILSITLKNKKYRWLALSTIILTVTYILFVGIAQLDPVYRIISFIIIGTVLLITSIIYTRIKSKSEKSEDSKQEQL